MDVVTSDRLDNYFAVTQKALGIAKKAPVNDEQAVNIILDMVERYVRDAKHFRTQHNLVLAFAALNYAHGWLDCGARLELFVVDDDTLFTVDVD